MKRWNSKRIAFVAILIATSIAFVVIGAQAAAISSLPNLKLSLAGLPVKIAGYLFGPITGFIIGFITDILTFLFVPVFYNPIYSLALALSGFIPGVFAWFYLKKFNQKFLKSAQIKKLSIKKIQHNHNLLFFESTNDLTSDKAVSIIKKIKFIDGKINILENENLPENKLMNFNLLTSTLFILFLVGVLTILLSSDAIRIPLSNAFSKIPLLQDWRTFLVFIWIGFSIIILFLVIARFYMKQENYIKIVPIMMFIVLTEFINLPIVALADWLSVGITFWTSFLTSFIISPIKIWFNLIIISFATKIVTPLIISKEANAYN